MASRQNDTTKNDVFHLHTPMTIAAYAEVSVTCHRIVKVENLPDSHVYVSATLPTTIRAGPKPVRIQPFGDWGEDFARGWRSLPLELMFEVLCYILAYERNKGQYTTQAVW